MSQNFDKKPFNRKERKAIDVLSNGFHRRLGKSQAMTNGAIREALEKHHNLKIAAPRIRSILHYIRVQGRVKRIVAGNKGYHVASNIRELKEYRDQLAERIRDQQALLNSVDRDIQEYTKNFTQQGLF